MACPDRRDLVDPVPLTEIPPLVLSQVLCDVDLFVRVAGVGNDPTWQQVSVVGDMSPEPSRIWIRYVCGSPVT